MDVKPLGSVKTLRQDRGGGGGTFQHTLYQRWQVCYQTDEKPRTTQQSAQSFNLPEKYGEWGTLKYAKYISHNNHSKHWVDDLSEMKVHVHGTGKIVSMDSGFLWKW